MINEPAWLVATSLVTQSRCFTICEAMLKTWSSKWEHIAPKCNSCCVRQEKGISDIKNLEDAKTKQPMVVRYQKFSFRPFFGVIDQHAGTVGTSYLVEFLFDLYFLFY